MSLAVLRRQLLLIPGGGILWLSFFTGVTFAYPHLAMGMVSSAVEFHYGKALALWNISYDDPDIDPSTQPSAWFEILEFWPTLATNLTIEPSLAYSPTSTHLHIGLALSGQLSTYAPDFRIRAYTVSPGLLVFYHHKKYDISPFIKGYYRHTFTQNLADLDYQLSQGSGYSIHLGAKLYFSDYGAILFAYEHTRTVYPRASGYIATTATASNDISADTDQHNFDLVKMKFKSKRGGLLVGIAFNIPAATSDPQPTPEPTPKPPRKKKKRLRSKPVNS